MANKKKLIGLGIGLVCVILLVVLLMTRCGGDVSDPSVPVTSAPVDVTETAAPADSATEVPTEPAEETVPEETEPVVETEPVEETEPDEESQGSSSGGNSSPGGTGGFTGGTGSSDSEADGEGNSDGTTTPEGVTVADPGTETNAYTEVLGDTPEEIGTVKIPADQNVYYNIYNAAGSYLTIEDGDAFVVYNGETYKAENGVVTVALAEAEGPVSLQIGSGAAEEKAYTLKFGMPVGTEQNPEVVEDISHMLITLPEGHNGSYYYRYNVIETGTLTMKFISMDPENGSCQIILTRIRSDENGETSETVASVDGVVSIDVEYGDIVIMQVIVEPPVTEAEIYIQGTLDVTTGTIDNPIQLTYPEDSIVIPAGKTVYYTANVAGASMTVTGEKLTAIAVEHNEFVYVAEGNVISLEASASGRGNSCLFAITNSSHEAVACDVTFAYPVGHSMNPAELIIGSNTAAIKEGCSGYYYSWTATQAGDLTITIDEANANGWFYSISKPESGYYGENHYDTDETPVTSETIAVTEGDVVEIIVNTNSATGIAPAGDMMFTAEFAVGAGTEENPYLIVGELEADLTVGAGETMWIQCRVLSMIFTLEGTEVEVAHDGVTHAAANGVVTFLVTGGSMYEPPVFAISNLSAEEKTYHVAFTYPVGTSENPEEVQLGENSVELEKDSIGYFYGFVAEEDGVLTITMDVEQNTAGWLYCVNNMTTEIYGVNHYSDEEEPVPSETIEVKAGDEIQIVLGTYAPGGVSPAGTVYFTAEFLTTAQAAQAAVLAAEPAAVEPEVVEPKAAAPEVTEPEATEPEAVESEVVEPEVTEPESAEPEVAEPEVSEPEVAAPEVVEPEVVEPEVTEPEVTEPIAETEPETETE